MLATALIQSGTVVDTMYTLRQKRVLACYLGGQERRIVISVESDSIGPRPGLDRQMYR
jgi:hypothetical protein